MAGTIHFVADAGIATVTLDSPGKLNAVSVAMWQELRRVFEALASDDAVRCIVMRGAGGNFAAGADLDEFGEVHHDVASGRRFHLETVVPSLAAIRDVPQPVVAAIDGVCAGGGLQIALACDVRLAADTARFGVPVGRLGLPVVLPELRLLLERLGQAVTAELLLTGRLLGAHEAYDKGLVARAVPAAELEQRVAETAHAIAASSPRAARQNKAQIRLLVERAMDYTAHDLDASFGFLESDDYREGIAAFIAKRHPNFTGK
jgi:enoyl-CoA hydratase/carnithine racemase